MDVGNDLSLTPKKEMVFAKCSCVAEKKDSTTKNQMTMNESCSRVFIYEICSVKKREDDLC